MGPMMTHKQSSRPSIRGEYAQRTIEGLLAVNIGVVGVYAFTTLFPVVYPELATNTPVISIVTGVIMLMLFAGGLGPIITNNVRWRMHILLLYIVAYFYMAAVGIISSGWTSVQWIGALSGAAITLVLRLNLWVRYGKE